MAKFSIEHPHSLPLPEVRKRLDVLSERLSSKYGIDAKWKNDTEAHFKRTGASGTIECRADKVVVNVDLSILLSPMRGEVERRIQHELEKALA